MLKRIFLSVIGLYLGNAADLQAVERFRTDINPALLYWQAWAQIPDLSEADRGYLFTNEWRGQVLPPRAGELLSRCGDTTVNANCSPGSAAFSSIDTEIVCGGVSQLRSARSLEAWRKRWNLNSSNSRTHSQARVDKPS